MVHFFTLITPLIGSLYIFFNGLYLGSKGSPFIAILSISFSWLSCLFWFYQGFFYVDLGSWFTIGIFSVHWSFNFNSLSWVMCITVSTVSLIVHIFSFFYMYKDPHINRFFSYLNLFTFFMLFLIVSNNLILMFWGWEGVGICSFLLINFWYTRIAANKSALKAVFINKISDIFFLYGIILFILEFNSTEIPVILCLVPFLKKKLIYCCGLHFFLLDIISFFLTLGSFGKSAQMGLHLWLPDAMEGPTPVSALIHAATMVTAGVFLLLRLSLLFDYSPFILKIILFLGSFTALISSLIGSFQYDIKKIIAYSTCSQLGYMFVACGFSNYTLSLFHLFNHAFFKSLLFLSSGLVIHSLHTQDIRKFEKKKITNNLILILFLVPSFSLCGFPFLSGSFSKENIIKLSLYTGFVNGDLVYLFLLVTAAITSFYSVKLLYFIYSPKNTYFFYSWKPFLGTGNYYQYTNYYQNTEVFKSSERLLVGLRKDLPNCPYHSKKYLIFDYIEYFLNEYQLKLLYRSNIENHFFIKKLFISFQFFFSKVFYLVNLLENWLKKRLLHYIKKSLSIIFITYLIFILWVHYDFNVFCPIGGSLYIKSIYCIDIYILRIQLNYAFGPFHEIYGRLTHFSKRSIFLLSLVKKNLICLMEVLVWLLHFILYVKYLLIRLIYQRTLLIIKNFLLPPKNTLLYLPLFILIGLSIFSGYLFQEIFLGISSNFFSKDITSNCIYKLDYSSLYFESFYIFKKFFPIFLSFFFFIFFDFFNYILKYKLSQYYFFKFKFFFDFVFNYISLSFNKYNFKVVFQSLDKGILEILGPNGITRYSFWMIKYIRFINKDLIFNYICLFLFFLTYSFLLDVIF